jgi:hypothetical protein
MSLELVLPERTEYTAGAGMRFEGWDCAWAAIAPQASVSATITFFNILTSKDTKNTNNNLFQGFKGFKGFKGFQRFQGFKRLIVNP